MLTKPLVKRSLIYLVTAGLLWTAVPPAPTSAVSLVDIEGSYAKDAIQALADKGILSGNGVGKFNPAGNISRQDFAIILAKALNLDVSSAPATATFSDVPTSHYAFNYVEAAVKAGLIAGVGNGQFGGTSNLSREQMAALFVRALGVDATGKGSSLTFSDANSISNWAKDSVAAAVELGLISGNGDGTFNPQGSAQRQQVAVVASKFLKTQSEQKPPEPSPSPSPEPSPSPSPTPSPSPNPTPTVQQVAAPTASPSSVTDIVYGTAVTFGSTTPDAVIYYTTDGNNPTVSSAVYSEPIMIYSDTTIKAFATKSGMSDSAVSTFVYKVIAAPPTASLPSGTVEHGTAVSLISTMPGATIYYTIGGGEPAELSEPTTASTLYTEPIYIANHTTIKAIAVVSGLTSDVATFTYTLMDY